MSEENDRIAAASSREADELKRTFRSGNQATITAAYEAAKGRQARWIERSHKLTTLAAVFVTDCTPAIVREYPDDKRRLLASLVRNDADTLRCEAKLLTGIERYGQADAADARPVYVDIPNPLAGIGGC